MLVDIDELRDVVIPQMKKSIENVELAKNIIDTINIPSDFSYGTRLINISQSLSEIYNKIKDVEKWTETAVEGFSNAENNNKSIMDNLISSIPEIAEGIFGENGVIDKSTKAIGSIEKEVQNAADYVFSGEMFWDAVGIAEKTGAKVVDGITNTAIPWFLNTGAEIKEGVTSFISDKIEPGINFIGAKISDAWDFTYKNIVTPSWSFLKITGASVANAVTGLVEGVCKLMESLYDVATMLSAGVESIGTGAIDGITYLLALSTDNTDSWESITALMWKKVMSEVAEEHVDNFFKDFYAKNVVGKWLDENAIGLFKSNGIGTSISSGIGYVAGIIALTLATAGIGTVATGVATTSTTGISATISGIAGAGNATQEIWGKMRDSSWSGIKRMYEKGEISEEELNTYVKIRNASDDEWAQIQQYYLNGNITEETFKQMKQIREMPDDWTTLENGVKGTIYGAGNGLWEGLQWYAGGKLNDWAYNGSKVATSAIRIGADTAFNALDTPYRTVLDSLINGKKLENSWEDHGGLKSLITSIGVGFIGSLGGEAFDNIIKLNKGKTTEFKKADVTDNIEETRVSNVDTIYDNKLMKIDNINEFWEENSFETGRYGVDQGICKKLRETDYDYYEELKKKIMEKYNMSAKNANAFMNYIDSKGACSYATASGNIIDAYRKNPIEFEDKFGFSLYRVNSEGKIATNEAELLADMYFVSNHTNNGGNLFKTDIDGKNIFAGKKAEFQKFMSEDGMLEQIELNKYLQTKEIECDQRYIIGNLPRMHEFYTSEDFEYVKNKVDECIKNGKKLMISAYGDEKNPVIYENVFGDIVLRMTGGHATQITGICDEGVIVINWGQKALIRFSNFQNFDNRGFQIIERIFKNIKEGE